MIEYDEAEPYAESLREFDKAFFSYRADRAPHKRLALVSAAANLGDDIHTARSLGWVTSERAAELDAHLETGYALLEKVRG